MNASVKMFSHSRHRPRTSSIRTQPISYKKFFGICLLSSLVLFTALAIVYVSDLNRRLFMDYQNLLATRSQLQVEWSRLLLEQSTWSSTPRIQSIAQQRLNMTLPSPSAIVMVQQ